MPTILELFKGSPMDKAVKADKDTVIEQEFSGIRPHSAVELNNPLLYGNEAIRIATRSTSSVEKMKQGTGGSAGDGGLIGKKLGELTSGKFGKFLFGGKVTSLNQARDGINNRLGIPSNAIPTYVYNTGGLQGGIEPDTMITIGKIKNDAGGTLLGQFLKKTGGGTPQTIGKNLLGGGISMGKGKLREVLFGKQNSMGSNTAKASDSFSGEDSGGKSAKLAWEYSSNLPYSKQISTAKFNTKAIDGYVEGGASNILKKTSQLQDDAKKKLGESALNAQNALLKGARKGTATQEVVDNGKLEREKNTPAWDNPYSIINKQYRLRKSTETKLGVPSQDEIDIILTDTHEKEKEKSPTNEEPKSFYYSPDSDYSTQLAELAVKDHDDGDGQFTRIDLKLVSPVYGVDRRNTGGMYGKSEYAFWDGKNNTGIYSPYNPTSRYQKTNKANWENTYGLTNGSDDISISNIEGAPNESLEQLDLIPFWIQSLRSGNTVHFRSYITGLAETVTPAWNTNKFFGNPYNFYTYDGVERSVSFTLKVIALNAKELAKNWTKIDFLTKMAYPVFDTTDTTKAYTKPPIVNFRLGNLYLNKIAYIESLSHTIEDETPWETNVEGFLLPKFITVAITLKFIESKGAEDTPYAFERTDSTIKYINEKNGAGGSFTTDRIEGNPEMTDKPKVTTPPKKIDKTGAIVKPTNEGGINKSPNSTNENASTQTPKEKQDGEGVLPTPKKPVTEWEKKQLKIQNDLENKGVETNIANFLSRQTDIDLNSITKLNEKAWYFEKPQINSKGKVTGTMNMVARLVDGVPPSSGVVYENYVAWVAWKNNGIDVLNKAL